MKQICVLPGDGIGPEVIGSAVSVLERATDGLQFSYGAIGQSAMESHGSALPDETLELMRGSDSTLFGAATSGTGEGYASPVLRFRKDLDLFANVRPVKSYHSKAIANDLDIVIVRENTEGLYNQEERVTPEGVITLRKVTASASDRIVRFAIGYAGRNGRRSVCCVHKSNVLRRSDGLFLSRFRELMAAEGGALEARDQLVDSAGLKLVLHPKQFDVIVTLNLYGDILSDVAAGVVGGLGFVPSGNIGPTHSVFEPAHGSAPDIQGRDICNPTAAILAGAMMLRHLEMRREADSIERAISIVYSSGKLTCDLGGPLGTEAFTHEVLRALDAGGDRKAARPSS
jgi:isopropylmalate/isohomocitrate dehydrogenase-like protein